MLCGSTSAPTAEIPLRAVFFKSLSILGSTMGANAELAALLPWFERGELAPVVGATMPLAELGAAHERLERREVFGKLVLVAGDEAHQVPRPRG